MCVSFQFPCFSDVMHGNIQRHKVTMMYCSNRFTPLIDYTFSALRFSFEFEMLEICELVKLAKMEI
jgi:hypothetical protein